MQNRKIKSIPQFGLVSKHLYPLPFTGGKAGGVQKTRGDPNVRLGLGVPLQQEPTSPHSLLLLVPLQSKSHSQFCLLFSTLLFHL